MQFVYNNLSTEVLKNEKKKLKDKKVSLHIDHNKHFLNYIISATEKSI